MLKKDEHLGEENSEKKAKTQVINIIKRQLRKSGGKRTGQTHKALSICLENSLF